MARDSVQSHRGLEARAASGILMASSFRDYFGRPAPSCLALAWAGEAAPVPTTVRLGACNCLHSPALFSALCPGTSLSKAILKMLAQASHGGQTMRRFLNPIRSSAIPTRSQGLGHAQACKIGALALAAEYYLEMDMHGHTLGRGRRFESLVGKSTLHSARPTPRSLLPILDLRVQRDPRD
jgi:hypothetical protein